MNSLKLKSLMLSNFGSFEQISINLNDQVTYLVGGNGTGKSTIGLTGLWFVMQGIASKATSGVKTPLIAERFRFIGEHGSNTTGTVVLFDEKTGAEIEITRKMTKSGQALEIKAPPGVTLSQDWLNDIFDPFMIAPAQFYNLSSKEQALALGIDTDEQDKAIAARKQDLSTEVAFEKRINESLNSNTLTFDELGFSEPKDGVQLSLKLSKAQREKDEATMRLAQMKSNNEGIERAGQEMDRLKREFKRAFKAQQESIKILTGRNGELFEKDAELQIMMEQTPGDYDVELISKEISEIENHNKKVREVADYKKKLIEQEQQAGKVKQARENVKAAEESRVNYLKESNKLPFDNMSVNDKGELLLNEKPIRAPYFSTGELLKYVPIILSETRPTPFKYVFLQDFSLMDEDKQGEIIGYLKDKGFQIVVEVVEKNPVARPNSIILTGETIINSES